MEGTPDPSPEEIEEIILAARKAGDSVGGAISCTVTGISAGFGAPDFGCNAEGIFAQHQMCIRDSYFGGNTGSESGGD